MTQLPDRQALRRLAAGLCIVSWLMFVPAMAADAQQTDAASSESPATALVELDGRPILRVRGVAGLSAVDRARVIKDRIIEFARDRDVPVGTLSLEESPLGTAIVAGGKPLLVVSDADSALEEMDRQTLARVTREILVERVKTWRAERAPEVRWRNAALAAAATLLLGVFLWIVSRVTRRLREYVRTRIASRVRSVGVQSFEFVKARHLQALAQSAPGFAFWVVVVAAIYTYLDFVLKLFPATRVLGEGLFSLVTDPLQTLGLGFLDQLPNLIFLVVLAFVVRYLLKLMRLYFEAIGRGALRFENFDAEWSLPTYKVLRLFVVILALVVAYPYIPGSDSAAFKGISVMLGVLFSLGSSSVIANVIAGYTMTYRRAFRTGDRIKVGEVMGEVVDSRIQVTMLRTPKNEMVVVPNSEILNTSLINYSTLAKTQGLVLHTTVGIGYETPWRQVEAMLLMAAARTEGLLREPPPFVLQKSLGDFCVVYEINAYTDSAARMPQLYSALHSNILDVFNEYGVQIMTPAYEGDTPDPKLVRPGDWYAAPARPPEAGTSVEREGG
jgi:small-conductance mechanosensitive channel